jgi:hypothetical protein
MTLFAEVDLKLTAPGNEEGLLRTATAAVHELERYAGYCNDVQVTLLYKHTSTQVVADSTPEGLVAAVKSKLSASYTDDNDRTSQ